MKIVTINDMKIKAIIMGSTGMVGKGVLLECLESPSVESILVINRNSLGIKHPKLKEIVHKDLSNTGPLINELGGYNACYFCLGISAAGLSEAEYSKITYDLTLNFAKAVLKLNPEMTFCYVSGAGTDSKETSRMMWARVKGKTENDLLALPFKSAYMFRPGYIQPMRGLRSRTPLYNFLFVFFKPFYFLLKNFKNAVTNTDAIGRAMINITLEDYCKNILDPGDINKLANAV
jgi:uncharacterized protein YbjT (DUF2867 family)